MFTFHKKQDISWAAEWLSASQEGLLLQCSLISWTMYLIMTSIPSVHVGYFVPRSSEFLCSLNVWIPLQNIQSTVFSEAHIRDRTHLCGRITTCSNFEKFLDSTTKQHCPSLISELLSCKSVQDEGIARCKGIYNEAHVWCNKCLTQQHTETWRVLILFSC